MAEISREEVKKIMNSVLGCLMGKYSCVGKPCSMCEHNVSDEEVKNAMEKTISDMEKLEKIEKIVEEMWDENSYYNNSFRFAEEIEQIVKGE